MNASSLPSLGRRLLAGLALFGATLLQAGENSRLVVHQDHFVVFPRDMLTLGFSEGVVRILFSVNPQGQLEDHLVIESTHPRFTEASVNALKRWTFEPARIDGEPVYATSEVTVNFRNEGTLVETSTTEFLIGMLYRMGKSDAYRVAELKDLDHMPNPVHIVRPPYPSDLASQGIEGTVKVEFFIDETGRVRVPALLERSNPNFVGAVMSALREWSFEPPLRKGKTVTVRVVQTFTFKTSKGT
jgi:TonB family protein